VLALESFEKFERGPANVKTQALSYAVALLLEYISVKHDLSILSNGPNSPMLTDTIFAQCVLENLDVSKDLKA